MDFKDILLTQQNKVTLDGQSREGRRNLHHASNSTSARKSRNAFDAQNSNNLEDVDEDDGDLSDGQRVERRYGQTFGTLNINKLHAYFSFRLNIAWSFAYYIFSLNFMLYVIVANIEIATESTPSAPEFASECYSTPCRNKSMNCATRIRNSEEW